jgi:hypothetical protein
MLSVTVDRTGFPVLLAKNAGLQVQLFPVLKMQLEQLLAEPNELDNTWYDEMRALNQRRSWKNYSDEKREELFVTGILPDEALRFASCLGGGFRLPTLQELRTVYHQWDRLRVSSRGLVTLVGDVIGPGPVWSILRSLIESVHGQTLAECSLMRCGVLEWVLDGEVWKGMGEPRHRFSKQLFSWHTPVSPILPVRRNRMFGFRLVSPL